ncbi:hypothetical protein LH935_28275 (plasmid) [Gordonia polyisoprenivorans]|uniref:hypothetical protein n=1 Tax=Gordonia polyisoprenivorans TaxID=84595 RepID=UPI00223404FA|nr:hypothetical protein LH935_28275 [Gordonia polyisoprenivorans]
MSERPITSTFTVNTSVDPQLSAEFDRFLDFGTPVHIPAEAASATFDLPGNLGGHLDQAEILITAMPGALEPVETLILGVRSESGEVVAELPMQLTGPGTVGVRGGSRAEWRDAASMVTLEIRTQPDPLQVEMTIHTNWEIAGRRPDEVLAGLEVIAAMQPGASVGISPDFGPRRYTFSQSLDDTREPHRMLRTALRMVRALCIVQKHYVHRLLVPSEMTADQLRDLAEAAELLQGRSTTATWTPFDFTPHADADLSLVALGKRLHVAIVTAITVTMDGTDYEFGVARSFLDATVTAVESSSITLSPSTAGSLCTRVIATDAPSEGLITDDDSAPS